MACWTLRDFGGYPKYLKCSSQSRPMTNLIKKTRPEGDPDVTPRLNPPPLHPLPRQSHPGSTPTAKQS